MQHFHKVTVLLFWVILVYSCQTQDGNSKNEPSVNKVFMKTDGQKVIDTEGNPIILKGTNLGNWLVPEGYMFKMGQVNAPRKIDELLYELIGPDSLKAFWDQYLENYITYEDIKYLKRIGCNHIRLPFHYKLFTDDLYMGSRNSGFKYFDRIVDWCKQENLYVLFDMHCAPGGQTGDNIDDSYGYPYLLKSQSSQDLMSEVWLKIADRYKNEPIVLGYDLINEPAAHYFNDEMDFFNEQLFLLYQRIIKEVREVDPNHIIFLNGSVWSGNFDVFKEMMGDNIVYEFHKYWFPVKKEAIQKYLDFRETNQVPVYIGETGENSDQWVSDFRTLLDEYEVPWCFWPYKKMNNTAGIMNFEEPEHYHLITEYAASDRSSYAKVRENRPDPKKVQAALNDFLEGALYNNNFQNEGYIKGLGLKPE
ncbi:MAG: cellulase family glycosylhydrolase [Saprospiraceae bacterium]|nr:cellulase family glycosylhydrolase [Saprospiraceae bacterium]